MQARACPLPAEAGGWKLTLESPRGLLAEGPLAGLEPMTAFDPERTFSDPHAPLYDTFKLQPHLIRRPPLRQLRTDAYQALAAASAAA